MQRCWPGVGIRASDTSCRSRHFWPASLGSSAVAPFNCACCVASVDNVAVALNTSPSSAAASAGHPYESLTPDVVLDALATLGMHGDGRLTALNSYENRVYQV